jgi:hypothetical protein
MAYQAGRSLQDPQGIGLTGWQTLVGWRMAVVLTFRLTDENASKVWRESDRNLEDHEEEPGGMGS